jgi:hypothetical protein
MRTLPEQFYRRASESRAKFAQEMQTKYAPDILAALASISDYIDGNYSTKAVMWVGGGRSWNHALECFYNGVVLDPLEQSATVPGNFDVFVAVNDAAVHSDISCFAFKALEAAVGTRTKKEMNGVKTTREGKCQITRHPTEISEGDECVLFPCQSMYYTERSSKKVVLYCETFLLVGIDIPAFRGALLYPSCVKGTRYYTLNPRGLLLISEFIDTDRKHKGLPVDTIRRRILTRVFESEGLSQVTVSADVIRTYISLFKNTTLVSKFLASKLVERLIGAAGIKTRLETWFIQFVRPFVNSFLKDLHGLLKSKFGLEIALVGGDAMKRYIPDQSHTADFDSKLFATPEFYRAVPPLQLTPSTRSRVGSISISISTQTTQSRYAELESTLVDVLSNFIAFLETVPFVYPDSGVIGIVPGIEGAWTSQFQHRFRYLEKPKFPVDLFSVDTRTWFELSLDGLPLKIPVNISWIDIAIVPSHSGTTDTGSPDIKMFNGVPVASREFLVRDLEKTWNDEILAGSRMWSGKAEKDIKRYRSLSTENLADRDSGTGTGTDTDTTMDDWERDSELNKTVPPELWSRMTDSAVRARAAQFREVFLRKLVLEPGTKHKLEWIG